MDARLKELLAKHEWQLVSIVVRSFASVDVTTSTVSFVVILTGVCTLWHVLVVGIAFGMLHTSRSSEAKIAPGIGQACTSLGNQFLSLLSSWLGV